MSNQSVSEFINGFRETITKPDDESPSAAVPKESFPQSADDGYWIPSKSWNQSESRKLNRLLVDWENTVMDRPANTVMDVRLAVREFRRFCRKKNVGLFRRKTFFKFRDALIAEGGLHPHTVGKKLGWLRLVIQKLEDDETLPANPARRIKVPTSRSGGRSRIAYDRLRLEQFLNSPAFREHYRPIGGAGEAVFWMPLISLYAGLRLEEIAQLRLGHIRCEDGIWFFHITDEDGGRLKTDNAERRVPIHQDLLTAGLLEYRDAVGNPPGDWLFPLLNPDRLGKRSGNFTKFFTRYLRKTVAITDSRLVFHSFRHTFRAACRRARIDEERADALMGHSAGSTGRRYGGEYPLEPLEEAVQSINFWNLSIPVWHQIVVNKVKY